MGIALPSWLVENDNGTIVLLGYVLVFMVILPAIVVSIWYKWKDVAPNSVM